MIALYPAAQHTGALRKTAICSIPFEREMLSLSDTSKIYPIKHKKNAKHTRRAKIVLRNGVIFKRQMGYFYTE